MSFMIWQGYQE